MQKPDDSNDPHPLYHPMKPDEPDFKPTLPQEPRDMKHGKYEAENVAAVNTTQYTTIPNQTPKQNWFVRLSRRTKIIAGVILLIVIFVAAFVPAYLTTHNNNDASTTTGSSNTTTKPPPDRPNVTAAGLPINNATYRITVGNGRNGCNQFLSVAGCSAGGTVDMYSGDDNSGRQEWLFTLVEGKTNIYNIVVGGRSGCSTFLSSSPCPSNVVTLFGGDDQSGRQQWFANPIGNTTNHFNLMTVTGRAGCNQFLSTADCTNSSNLVDMFDVDDGSGRQRWVLTRIF
ncbi:hypothetical protein K450DRAFT_219824 [Umbelopsis ramanniana AG]|uniref:Uncharacterized protein n=1 Tax=Umbelopsis ramanniana AG TaxID=1314678 RepID=A0AAD5HHD9_UMBRA|nr:uncharacterized protein K450DRAFT_219824 [Umbelopsis ramanniana AG]KAI8584430.1 hypothetical protein K450DRAFT_219824 [Umbelopsis ramanniana AG]